MAMYDEKEKIRDHYDRLSIYYPTLWGEHLNHVGFMATSLKRRRRFRLLRDGFASRNFVYGLIVAESSVNNLPRIEQGASIQAPAGCVAAEGQRKIEIGEEI